MATKKISELEAITEADDSDVLAIVDVSEGKTNKITKNNLLIGAGHSIEMSLNQETYALTLTLKNAAGTELSTASIDLPNENSITDISYNNGKLTLTKQSGATTEVDISGLIEGLVTESDFNTFTTALQETIGAINVKNEQQDEAIEENYKVVTKLQEDVEDLTERMEDAEKNQLTNTPTPATSHYLQDSADSRFRKFIPIGRTTQESTTGKNLFNEVQLLEATDWQVNNGVYSGTIDNWFSKFKSGFTGLSFETNTQYTISLKGYTTGGTPRIKIVYTDNTSSTLAISASSMTEYLITSTSGKTISSVQADFGSGSAQTLSLSEVQIEKGTSKTSWEKYTGGNPAPNPNYPYAIKNTGDNVNEFDKDDTTKILDMYVNPSNNLISSNSNAKSFYIECEKNKQYTISRKAGQRFVVGTTTTIPTSGMTVNNKVYDLTADKLTIQTGSNDNYIICFYYLSSADTLSEEEIRNSIKVEKGTKATPYSPYGCGNVNEKVQNKNLFDKSTAIVGAINKNTGAINTNDTLYWSSDFIEVKPNNDYSNNISVFRSDSYGFALYDRNKNYITGITATNNISVPNNENIKYLRFCFRNETATNYPTDINIVQLEQGSTATSYVPHSEQNISFPLGEGQKFYEGSHPDDDEKVHHKWGEMVLPAINSLTSGTVFGVSCKFGAINIPTMKSQSSVSGNFFCDKVKYANGVWGKYQGYVIAKNFVVLTDLEDTVENFNSKISGATLQFPLEQEQTEDFTEEQKTAWEEWKKARTYKNVTHISSEDETPANVEIEYVVDINTIDDRITALEAKVDLLEE